MKLEKQVQAEDKVLIRFGHIFQLSERIIQYRHQILDSLGETSCIQTLGGTPCRRPLERTPRNRMQELIKVRSMIILEDGKQLLRVGKFLIEEGILDLLSLLTCPKDLHILNIMDKVAQLSSKKLRI